MTPITQEQLNKVLEALLYIKDANLRGLNSVWYKANEALSILDAIEKQPATEKDEK